MNAQSKRQITLPKKMAKYAAAIAITTSILSTDTQSNKANAETLEGITITTGEQLVQCNVKAVQAFLSKENIAYNRHDQAALEILKSDLPACVDIDSILSNQTPFYYDILAQSFIWKRSTKDKTKNEAPDKLLSFELDELNRLRQPNILFNDIYHSLYSRHKFIIRASGNDGREAKHPIPYDIGEKLFNPLTLTICANSHSGEMHAYPSPRCTFSTMNGTALGAVKTPYYPTAKELLSAIEKDEKNKSFIQSKVSLVKEWIDTYFIQNSLKEPKGSKKPKSPKEQIVQLAAQDARIKTPNTSMEGTSFSAPEAGNIFTNAIIQAQNYPENMSCGYQLSGLDYIFLAAASADKIKDPRLWFRRLDNSESAGGAFNFNLIKGGYGWLRAGRLTHLVNEACAALRDKRELMSHTQVQQKIIPISSKNRTNVEIRSTEKEKKHGLLLAQRIVKFNFTGKPPAFAHISFNGTNYRLPVHALPQTAKHLGLGIIVMKGVIGAHSTDYMWLGLRDKNGNKPNSFSFSLSGNSVEVIDAGVKPGGLWDHMLTGLKNGTITQAPTCKEITEKATKGKDKASIPDIKLARLCR